MLAALGFRGQDLRALLARGEVYALSILYDVNFIGWPASETACAIVATLLEDEGFDPEGVAARVRDAAIPRLSLEESPRAKAHPRVQRRTRRCRRPRREGTRRRKRGRRARHRLRVKDPLAVVEGGSETRRKTAVPASVRETNVTRGHG